jgi:hypothetical protein
VVQDFCQKLEFEGANVGLPLTLCSEAIYCSDNSNELHATFMNMKIRGARITMVLLNYDAYPFVKLAADSLIMPTQCIKWSNLMRPPKGYHTSLLVKMNYKMGGINHTLASRLPANAKKEDYDSSFQFPPKSISWLFDDPCMVMGVDVSLPEKGDFKARPIAAVVASMDGMLGMILLIACAASIHCPLFPLFCVNLCISVRSILCSY